MTIELGTAIDGSPVSEIAIFDLSGRRVRRLVAGRVENGRQVVLWDGRGNTGLPLAPGVYLLSAVLRETRYMRRIVIVP